MGIEKLPKEYEPGKIQRIVEGLGQKIGLVDKNAKQSAVDMSKEFNDTIQATKKELVKQIGGDADNITVPKTLPVPQDLIVKELFGFVICSVKPLSFWKYLFAGVKGYEFYGSYNSGFSVQPDDYIQTGTHYGADSSDFLLTENDGSDPSITGDSFIIDQRVVKVLEDKRLTLENVTQGTSGTIAPAYYKSAYKLQVPGVSWDTGDVWRIVDYPSNRLFSMGPWAMFLKSYKTINCDVYVKVRTVGSGHSFSSFAESDTTTGSETLPAPLNLSAAIKTRLVSGNDVYWVQDTPFVDIVLEWDSLDSEYGLITYEIREPRLEEI